MGPIIIVLLACVATYFVIKEAYNVTVAGKAVQTKKSGLGTKKITIVIK